MLNLCDVEIADRSVTVTFVVGEFRYESSYELDTSQVTPLFLVTYGVRFEHMIK